MARYVGKRIVPKHCGYWDNTKAYEMENIVYDRTSGNSYISRKAVPVGTDISQEEYWALCSDFNMQMDLLEKHFTATEQRIKADNDATEQAIRQDNDETERAIRQDNAATKQHVDESLEETTTDLTQKVMAAQTAMTQQKASFDATAQQLNTRMDAVLAAGTGDGATEVADARVDEEGIVHDSLGSNIRRSNERIVTMLRNTEIEGYGREDVWIDKTDGQTRNIGYWDSQSHIYAPSEEYFYYEFPVSPGEKYHVKTVSVVNERAAVLFDNYNNEVVQYPPEKVGREIIDTVVLIPSGVVKMIVNGNTGSDFFLQQLKGSKYSALPDNAILLEIDKKMDKTRYDGIGELPMNMNTGEGSLAPVFLAPRQETEHYPAIRMVEDTDSPVADIFPYKRELYCETYGTGWLATIDSCAGILNEETDRISIGFWVKDSEIEELFSSKRKLVMYFLPQAGMYLAVQFDIAGLIATEGNEVSCERDDSTRYSTASSWGAEAVCLHKNVVSGYSYVRIDYHDIVWNDNVYFAGMKWYWSMDSSHSLFVGRKLTIAGLTVLTNATIQNGYYRYPDRLGTNQYPFPESVEARIQQLSEKLEKSFKLVYTPSTDPDVSIFSDTEKWQIVQECQAMTGYGANDAVNPTGCAVIDRETGSKYVLVKNEDDACPMNLTSGYLGAGHGYFVARKATAAGHGKTPRDIPSKWVDGNGKIWFIVSIMDENNLMLLSTPISRNDYDTGAETVGSVLTHMEGAIHTDNINVSAYEYTYLKPVAKNHRKCIVIDGKENVEEAGTYGIDNYVDIIDEYDVISPATIVDTLKVNRPADGYVENPPLNVGETFLTFSTVYRYLKDGTLLVISSLDCSKPIQVGYWGATQFACKAAKTAFGGTLKRYVPKTLPVTMGNKTVDLRFLYDMASWNETVNLVKDTWEDANNPPDRLIHYFTDSADAIKAGYAVGYLPIGLGEPSARKNNLTNAACLYQSQKYYPHLIDNGGEQGRDWPAFSLFQSVVYRKPVLDVWNKHTSVYFVPLSDCCYVYADYHSVADDRIKIPKEYVGRKMTVLEKSGNVNVYGTIATEQIRVRVTEANPMYGYAVIQIGGIS